MHYNWWGYELKKPGIDKFYKMASVIFLIPKVEGSELNYAESINWASEQIDGDDVFLLREQEVDFLSKPNGVFHLVNFHNKSMIGRYEDDAIYDNEIKHYCLAALNKYIEFEKEERKATVGGIIKLLSKAIEENRPIVFFILGGVIPET